MKCNADDFCKRMEVQVRNRKRARLDPAKPADILSISADDEVILYSPYHTRILLTLYRLSETVYWKEEHVLKGENIVRFSEEKLEEGSYTLHIKNGDFFLIEKIIR
jgi:hypothetical protein